MKENNKWKYQGDSRYEKVWANMQLLGIQDVTTDRQHKNGTIVWRLPILSDNPSKYIEYASFKSGYVRNQGVDCRSNWQINKCKIGDTKERILIINEIERLEYMMSYVIKNEFIKRANTVQKGNFVPKWQYDNVRNTVIEHGVDQYVPNVKVIIDGHRYNII